MEYLKEEILKGLQTQEKEWIDEETEALMDFYRENEFLWNHNVNEYRNVCLSSTTTHMLTL